MRDYNTHADSLRPSKSANATLQALRKQSAQAKAPRMISSGCPSQRSIDRSARRFVDSMKRPHYHTNRIDLRKFRSRVRYFHVANLSLTSHGIKSRAICRTSSVEARVRNAMPIKHSKPKRHLCKSLSMTFDHQSE